MAYPTANEHDNALRLQTPLGRVRGLGSAKNGTHHWYMQRVTSIALLPLTLWFAFSLAGLAGAPYERVAAWAARPLNATLLVLTIAISFHHTAAGMQVVLEDYIRPDSRRRLAILAVQGSCLVLAVLGVLSVLRLAL